MKNNLALRVVYKLRPCLLTFEPLMHEKVASFHMLLSIFSSYLIEARLIEAERKRLEKMDDTRFFCFYLICGVNCIFHQETFLTYLIKIVPVIRNIYTVKSHIG